MKKAYVYRITNPEGKIYVGSTLNYKQRLDNYRLMKKSNQTLILNSMIKYGFENHKFEILFECDIKDRFYYENKYGFENNVLSENGLNVLLPKIGKEKCMRLENRLNQSINSKTYLKNNIHPQKGKTPWNKGIEFLKGENNPMYGVKRTDEWKKNHSERSKQRNKRGAEHKKSIMVIDIINGIFYVNIKEASDLCGINYSTLREKLRENIDGYKNLKLLRNGNKS